MTETKKDPFVGIRVLIVDDDPATRRVMKRLLDSCGFDTDTRASTVEALERVRAGDLNVLLTDFVMPGLTGVDLVKATRDVSPATRCVIISGQARSPDAPGDVTWLSKPLDLDALLAELGVATVS